MSQKAKGPGLFYRLLVFYAVVFAARAVWRWWVLEVDLSAGKPAYLHYEFVDISLRTRDPELKDRWRAQPPRAGVMRGGQLVTTIGGATFVPLVYDDAAQAFVGRWPCPWNAPAGLYDISLLGNDDVSGRIDSRPFRIERRRPLPFPQGFVAVNLESVQSFRSMRVRTPSGEMSDWKGLLDWVQFVGADAFWMLGGETPGLRPGEIWVSSNFDMVPEIARECHRRHLKFGIYAMCYLTFSKKLLSRYRPAMEVEDGGPVETRAISLNDPRRPDDVLALLKRFHSIPDVDYVGLDYIRNALGGYELAEDFYKDMGRIVLPPPGWDRLSPDAKMVYLARKKIMRRDKAFIDAWEWWRAHKVGGIVHHIKEGLGNSKPLWVFQLTWEKGWQHGQDPVMMNDGGVDAEALMLYEADKPQFEALINDWHRYVRRDDAQLIVGDVVDWNLHQKSPDGPKEFGRRLLEAGREIYLDGPARGIFIHDLARALGGRLGPWKTRGWMEEAKETARTFKALSPERKE